MAVRKVARGSISTNISLDPQNSLKSMRGKIHIFITKPRWSQAKTVKMWKRLNFATLHHKNTNKVSYSICLRVLCFNNRQHHDEFQCFNYMQVCRDSLAFERMRSNRLLFIVVQTRDVSGLLHLTLKQLFYSKHYTTGAWSFQIVVEMICWCVYCQEITNQMITSFFLWRFSFSWIISNE